MKRKTFILICYIIIIILTISLVSGFSIPVLYWNSLKSTPLNVWIVDKTVPNTDYREHNGLMWVLNSKKVVYSKTGLPFRYDTDYYGFFPVNKEKNTTKELPKNIENPELIYLADTYGVYKDDYFSNNIEGSRSDLIYGGLNDDEMKSIKANLGNKNTIIGEFNTASSPTNVKNRNELGEIFKVSWYGWSGRYFRELSSGVEVPIWVVSNYEKQYQKKWDFWGAGFVLVSDDDKIVVLKQGKQVGSKCLTISFIDQYKEEFVVKDEVSYDYWFEFITSSPSAEVLAKYSLDLTDEGKAELSKLGLPDTFPAVVRSANTQYNSYYFAGDFADGDVTDNWWNYYGFSKLKETFAIGTKGDNKKFYWKFYIPMMEKIIEDIKVKNVPNKQKTYFNDGNINYNTMAQGTYFKIYKDDKWQDIIIKGVDIGSSIPGKWFTEFSNDESMFVRWFEQIAAMNANAVRVYTLMSPQFYSALEYYNKSHPDKKLWLYQEIWPDENPENGDYLKTSYNNAYVSEIKNVIDAVHGKANIEQRKGRAYGIYTSDVSQYILGYLVGRELEPEEVIATNKINTGFGFAGKYLYCEKNASPSEAWLAMSCDTVLEYEAQKYGWQHPVGIVSWPTLDPKMHSSEWNISGDKSLEYNDKISIDINHISTTEMLKTGFFGAYHIYPNYPDFMNNEPSYTRYLDDTGILRYGGYLKEFIEGHKKYTALVAEFGLSTGLGNAHSNPDGYNHGGVTEQQQGDGIVRMMQAILREGYAGGLIFEWSDEWAKKTWITEPYIILFERNVFWHNAADPEQNYGILAMESDKKKSDDYIIKGNGAISQIKLWADETYLNMEIELLRDIDFSKEDLIIGLDTYDRQKGEFKYSSNLPVTASSGLEYIIRLNSPGDAQLLVNPGYNITKNKYSSYKSQTGIFEKMISLINKERITMNGAKINAIYNDESKLNLGDFINNSYNSWNISDRKINIRIPWGRINFTDPSNMRVLDDTRTINNPLRDQLNTVISEGILISGVIVESNNVVDIIDPYRVSNKAPFKWDNWDNVSYKERLKGSYYIIANYFKGAGLS